VLLTTSLVSQRLITRNFAGNQAILRRFMDTPGPTGNLIRRFPSLPVVERCVESCDLAPVFGEIDCWSRAD
jgi:hypothetical protein